LFTCTKKTVGRFTLLGTFDIDLAGHKFKLWHLFLGLHSLIFSC